MLIVHQHHVEIICIRQLAQLIDFFLRICTLAGRHLRHQPVGISRDAVERHAQHLVHLAVTFGGLEESNASVVGIPHQPGELVLPEFALGSPAHRSGAEREPRHLHAGPPKRYPICCSPARGPQAHASGSRQHTRGESGLQEIASGEVSH